MPPFFIVQNTKTNLERFGMVLYNSANIVNLPLDAHRAATAYFSSVQYYSLDMPVREWASVASYEQQYELGMEILKHFGVREKLSFTIRRNYGKLVTRIKALFGIEPGPCLQVPTTPPPQ
jgi:hypothetical protein